MNKLQRLAVKSELEKDINIYFGEFVKEKVFNTFMPVKRQFRADYFIPSINTIIEVNGGQFINGRHNRGGKGYEDDLIKLNMANRYGFIVLQYTYEMLKRQEYIKDFTVLLSDNPPF